MAPDSFFPAIAVPKAHHTHKYLCTICMETLCCPIELGCGNITCLHYCTRWLSSSDSISCPCCYDNQTTSNPPQTDHLTSTSNTSNPNVGSSLNMTASHFCKQLSETSSRNRKAPLQPLQRERLHMVAENSDGNIVRVPTQR